MSRRNPFPRRIPANDELDWRGSPKQIAWAKSIRTRRLPEILAAYDDLQADLAALRRETSMGATGRGRFWSGRAAGGTSRQLAFLAYAPYIADARWWIDNRDREARLIRTMADDVPSMHVDDRLRWAKDNPRARLLPMPRLSKTARRQLRRGAAVEMEHTRSRKAARLIAAHHLVESPRYYQALARMERGLQRRNPKLGNTGWEFKQRMARTYLIRAMALEGMRTEVADEIIETGFRHAKQTWEQRNNRILPHREWPALRVESTLALAQLVASGEIQRP